MRIVAVHGVGNPLPGSVLAILARNASKGGVDTFVREDLIVGGVTYPRARGTGQIRELIEVNWSDLRWARKSVRGVLKHLLWLVTAMLSVAVESAPPRPRTTAALTTYRRTFEGFLFWSLLIPIHTMLLVVSRNNVVRALETVAAVAATLVLVRVLRPHSKWFAGGLVWAVLLMLLGWMTINDSSPKSLNLATSISAWIYVIAQIMIAVLLVPVAWSLLVRRSDLSIEQRLAYFSLLYLPFAILSGLGALVWSSALALAKNTHVIFDAARFEEWGVVFTDSLGYDLRTVELAFTIAIAGIGVLGLLVTAAYLLRTRHTKSSTRSAGEFARDALGLALLLMPIFLSMAGTVFAFSLVTPGGQSETGPGVLDVYATSARRVLPFLLFALGPLAVAVDVLGDVLFFLTSEPLSIRQEAVRRVKNVLEYLRCCPSNDDVIFCHSQGSVLVREALSEFPGYPLRLVTVGSPLDALYGRFLGWEPRPANLDGITWINGFRSGDYIGGPVKEAQRNQDLGAGGHVDYWTHAGTWQFVVGASGAV